MTPLEFFSMILPYAKRASGVLDIPTSVIMSQWALESDYGNSQLALATGNLGGIKYTSYAPASYTMGSNVYANYKKDFNVFTNDYIRVLSRNAYGYPEARAAVSVEDTVKALSASQYAESHYGGGADLMARIKTYQLTKYDSNDISGGGSIIKNFSVDVPQGANDKIIAGAIIALGVSMLIGLFVKD